MLFGDDLVLVTPGALESMDGWTGLMGVATLFIFLSVMMGSWLVDVLHITSISSQKSSSRRDKDETTSPSNNNKAIMNR